MPQVDSSGTRSNGVAYGIPHGRGREPADVPHRRGQARTRLVGRRLRPELARTRARSPRTTRPIYIADARALPHERPSPTWTSRTRTRWTTTSSLAAVDLLKRAERDHRRVLVGLHQKESRRSSPATRCSAPPGRSSRTWPRPTARPVEAILPTEGATGWSDTWMISSKAKHPNCAYMWMNYIVSPKANAAGGRVVRRGAVEQARLRRDGRQTDHCTTFHADDEAYFEPDLVLDHADRNQCLDGRDERHLQGLRGLDAGLDGDQGLTTVPRRDMAPAACRRVRQAAAPARVVAAPPRRRAAGALLLGADGSGSWSPTSARSPCCSLVVASGRSTASPASWSSVPDAGQLQTLVHRAGLPHVALRSVIGVAAAGDRHRRADRAPDGASSWPRSPRRGPGDCWSSRS